jgi:hypothetical protein
MMVLRKPGPSFDDPLEMLAACHERIEAQLMTLERLAQHARAKGWDADARAATQSVMRYFDTAGRLHHEDEDDDVFPMLRAKAAAAHRADIEAAVEELHHEHAALERSWQLLRRSLLEQRLEERELARFTSLYRRHMEREHVEVLPYARETLGPAERATLGVRMAARRRTP